MIRRFNVQNEMNSNQLKIDKISKANPYWVDSLPPFVETFIQGIP